MSMSSLTKLQESLASKKVGSIVTSTAVVTNPGFGRGFDNVVLRDVTTERWMEMISYISKESSRIEDFTYSGAEHPVDRRDKMMLTFKVGAMITFMGVKNFRGFSFANYASKNDKTALEIREMIDALDVKIPKVGDRPAKGKYSPIAIVVSFSDISIAVQEHLIKTAVHGGNLQFGSELYKPVDDRMDPKYYFVGSLACMFHPMEAKSQIEAMVLYATAYERFQDWYINVRREAAKKQTSGGKNRVQASDKTIEEAKNRSRSYYLFSLTTFSFETRRSWFEGDYSTKIAKGDVGLRTNKDLIEALAKAFKVDPSLIANPVPVVRK